MKVTDKQIIKAAASAESMKEAAAQLGIPFGTFKHHAIKLNVYKPNQHGLSKNRVLYLNRVVPTFQELTKGDPPSLRLKKSLIHFSLKEPKCELCGQDENWFGSKLTFELDHIDGNRNNNELGNLRILCPNCHSTTPTWRGRNKGRKSISDSEMLKALNNHKTIRQSLISLGMAPKGANYDRAKKLKARMVE